MPPGGPPDPAAPPSPTPPFAAGRGPRGAGDLNALLARSQELVEAGRRSLEAGSLEEQAVLRLLRRFPLEGDGDADSGEGASPPERRPEAPATFGQNILLPARAGDPAGLKPAAGSAGRARGEGPGEAAAGSPGAAGVAPAGDAPGGPPEPAPAPSVSTSAPASAAAALEVLAGLDLRTAEASVRDSPAFARLAGDPAALRAAALRAAVLDPAILAPRPGGEAGLGVLAGEASDPRSARDPHLAQLEETPFGRCAALPLPFDAGRYFLSAVEVLGERLYAALSHKEHIDRNAVLVFDLRPARLFRAYHCPVPVTAICADGRALEAPDSGEPERAGSAGGGPRFFAVGCRNGEFLLYDLAEEGLSRASGLRELEAAGTPVHTYLYRLGARSAAKQPILALGLSRSGDLLRTRVLVHCLFKSGAAGFYSFVLAPGAAARAPGFRACPVAELTYVPLPQTSLDVSFDSQLRRNVLVARARALPVLSDSRQGEPAPALISVTGTLGGTLVFYSLPASPALAACRAEADLRPLLPGAYAAEGEGAAEDLLARYAASLGAGTPAAPGAGPETRGASSRLESLLAFNAAVTAIILFNVKAASFVLAASADGELGLWQILPGKAQSLVREFLFGNVSTPNATLHSITDVGHSPIVQFANCAGSILALHSDGTVSRVSLDDGSDVLGRRRADSAALSLSVRPLYEKIADPGTSVFFAVEGRGADPLGGRAGGDNLDGPLGDRGAARSGPAGGEKHALVFLRSGRLVLFAHG